MALALLTTALPSSVVTATTQHCPDGGTGHIEATYDGQYNDVVIKKGRIICVKGSTEATGKIVADGTSTLYELLGNGHDVSYFVKYGWKKQTILRYGGRILGPCGDPFYTARIWNGSKSTRPVTIILEVRGGRTLWKRTLQPGQSMKPRATWLPGGKVLILRRGNGSIIDRERTVTGTFSWSECRNG